MKSKLFLFALLATTLASVSPSMTFAQGGDAVYRSNSGAGSTKISGKVVDMSPTALIIESRGARTSVPASEVRSVVFSGQSSLIARADERIKAGNYAQVLEDVGRIEDKGNPYIAHELAYLKAFAEGNLALQGTLGAREAGTSLNNFLTKYKKSYHFIPATELKGRLLYSLKFLDLAAADFKTVANSEWPEYAVKGQYNLAKIELAKDSFDQAIANCDQIINSTNNDEITELYKLLAKCMKAKAQCLSGNPGSAEVDLKKIIKVENPDNHALFAAAYNALGVCHFKSGQLKEAREKFLMTHLLMYSEGDSHAEALYYLAQIWAQLGNTNEANKARELLKSRYRNSYWAQVNN
ncbi:hypothetical protein OAG71_05290 [bacterium]|nr:hypothetical protein [bacterium]